VLATYAYDLAWLFSRFYEAVPALVGPSPWRAFRLWLVGRTRATLADALGVIGLPAPELM
jgi:arginyl-tRNA synthetase